MVGGQVEDSSEGVYTGAGYPGMFSSHPNFYQPHTPRGGSWHYHQRNNIGSDIVVGGCNYGSEAASPSNWFGMFHVDDSSEFDWEELSPLIGSYAMTKLSST